MLTGPSRAAHICCIMLPFATFIDTRGLEHCWEFQGTFFKVLPPPHKKKLAQASVLQLVAFISHICCTMLPFATFKETGGLEYCCKNHETFLGKSFQPKFFSTGVAVSCLEAVDWQTQNLVYFLPNQTCRTKPNLPNQSKPC